MKRIKLLLVAVATIGFMSMYSCGGAATDETTTDSTVVEETPVVEEPVVEEIVDSAATTEETAQ